MNKYEIDERVRGHVCPECKSELALSWTPYGVYEVNCPECGWGKEVARCKSDG